MVVDSFTLVVTWCKCNCNLISCNLVAIELQHGFNLIKPRVKLIVYLAYVYFLCYLHDINIQQQLYN
jgi:hypothetical protein